MKRSIHFILYIALIVILGAMVLFGTKAYNHAIVYEDATKDLVTYHDAGQQASLKFERFAKSLLGDLYDDELKMQMDRVREKQTSAMVNAQQNTLYFMCLLALLLLISFFISIRTFTLFGSIAALMTLTLGLITPILMVTIHKEVEYLGDIVLSFESKGVIGSIVKLWETGDIIVAIVILLEDLFTLVINQEGMAIA